MIISSFLAATAPLLLSCNPFHKRALLGMDAITDRDFAETSILFVGGTFALITTPCAFISIIL